MGERLKGKVAIVTGAGSIGPGIGNGKATAILFAREGARVMLVDYNLKAANETKRIIDEEGGSSFVFKADVSKSGDCKSMIEECIQTFGRVDILHNNVGIKQIGGVVETSEETWDRVMDVNLKSMFLTCKYVLPHMEKQGGGCIINISSIAAISRPQFPTPVYSASKAGVIALTREIAIEYAPKGIRANAILPGYVYTPFMDLGLRDADVGDVDELMRKREAMIPIRKLGDAWDVAYAALFLVSDEAKYITGTILLVDGGITSTMRL